MNIRIEFARSRSSSWAWVLRLAKKQPGYSVKNEDGMEIHSLTFNERSLRPAIVLLTKLRTWRDVTIFIDGEMIAQNEAWSRVYRLIRPQVLIDTTLDQLAVDLNKRLENTGARIDISSSPRPRPRSGPDPKLGF